MKLNDQIVAGIRTFVPWLVGVIIAQLALAGIDVNAVLEGLSSVGVVVNVDTVVMTVTGIVTAAYYALAKWAEAKWPNVGWLLGYPASPTYNK
jgi:hypothetical protein